MGLSIAQFKKILHIVINVFLPTLIFYCVYKIIGIITATVISTVYSGIMMINQYRKTKEISATKLIGLLGMVGSVVAIYFTNNSKYYYIPALTINIITFGIMLVLSIQKKSVLHFLLRDMDLASVNKIPQHNLLPVNMIWLCFFALKIITKLVGIIYLDFDKLYWLVYIMGDPAMIVVIILTVIILRKNSGNLT